ncbi:unnamed protein product [Mycena citricolor]|uniref:Protein BCP1 n=1 Tax=Mycena citricolor TaxID=2018698 RepID=A0AAD2Q7I5_9AGAR|nr:unnamed protein product [Mycena citricolor]
MAKRKQDSTAQESDSDSDDVSFVDVDFEFFDPNPKVDYHALKRLLDQLFQRDAERFSTSALVDLIFSQPTVGTTIKTDGIESDPYALLTVLNMHVHQTHPSIASLAEYFLEKTAADPAFQTTLRGLFANSQAQVGLVLCERLMNMPVQTVPPMYRMLSDELKWALADSEPYAFTHLLFVSRHYHLTQDEEEALANRAPSRRSTKAKKQRSAQPPQQNAPEDGIYSFHPEDACIREHALHALSYPFSAAPPEPRDSESFGLDVRGSVMLVEAPRWDELIAKMAEVYV